MFAKDFRCKTFPLHDQFLCLQDRTINLPGELNIIFFYIENSRILLSIRLIGNRISCRITITNRLIFAEILNFIIVFLFAERKTSSSTSPGKAKVEGKNDVVEARKFIYQCLATIIVLAQVQLERHPNISYPIPMLWVNPRGVIVLVYDSPNDVLMISQRIEWDYIAFVAVWFVLHYSLFSPNALSNAGDYCCGYSTAALGASLDDPWYLVSPAVYLQPRDTYKPDCYTYVDSNFMKKWCLIIAKSRKTNKRLLNFKKGK